MRSTCEPTDDQGSLRGPVSGRARTDNRADRTAPFGTRFPFPACQYRTDAAHVALRSAAAVTVGTLAGSLGPDADVSRPLHEFLAGSNNYRGSTTGRTALDEVTIGSDPTRRARTDRRSPGRGPNHGRDEGDLEVGRWHSRRRLDTGSRVGVRNDRIDLRTRDEPTYSFERPFGSAGRELYVCGSHEGPASKVRSASSNRDAASV